MGSVIDRSVIDVPVIDVPVIDVLALTVHYGSSPVLWDVNVSIPQGKLVGIIGPNGAGKSTLLKAMVGLIPISMGSVRIFGGYFNEVRKRVAYVPQKESVDWSFPITVRELVELGLYPHRGLFSPITAKDHEKVRKAIDDVGLTAVMNREIQALSGGQQQRAFIARALVQDADLYLLDEPFAGIDHVSEELILQLLKKLIAAGKSCVLVHHDLDTVQRYFDWVLLLNTCRVAQGTIAEVFKPSILRRAYGEQFVLLSEALRLSHEYEG